jgi:hypothetical protein
MVTLVSENDTIRAATMLCCCRYGCGVSSQLFGDVRKRDRGDYLDKCCQINHERRVLLRRAALLIGTASFLGACGGGEAGTAATPPTPSPPVPSPPPSPPPQAPPPVPPAAPRPSWAGSVVTDTWQTLSGTAFRPWAEIGIPQGAYRGSNAIDAIVDAYCDPAHDAGEGAQYFFGGGHSDGTCNAVCKFDHQALAWSLVGQPTPPSVYLPGYPSSSGVTYPSGVAFSGRWFLSAAELSDPRDLPYAAPALARVSTHMYAAAARRGTRVHYFYGAYGEFDTSTGKWMGREVDLGAQLLRFRPQYNAVPLQQGTVAFYDAVTDRFFVTLNPGDSGGGWRSGIIVFDPTTRSIEAIHETNESTYGLIPNSMNICQVGRNLYCFTKLGRSTEPQVMNQGFMFNMDTKLFKRFSITGDMAGSTYPPSQFQEGIPSFYDGTAIRRWNYAPDHRSKIYSVNPAPTGGSGSPSDPYVLQQSVRTVGGVAPAQTKLVYSRFVYHGGAGCALLLPDAQSDWIALKLT